MNEEKKPNPLIAMLIGQAINIVARAATGGAFAIPDAVPLVSSLVDALGHAAGETDEQRAARRAETEAMFEKHSESLLPAVAP